MNHSTTQAYAVDTLVQSRCPLSQTAETILTLPFPWRLESGAVITGLKVAVRMSGPAEAPVAIILGGLSDNRRMVSRNPDQPGWWQDVLHPLLDGVLDRYRLLGIDYLGGNGETTGPGHWEDMAPQFPEITSRDQSNVLAAVLDHWGIDQVDSLIGASFGGMVGLRFAHDHPQRLKRLMVIGAAHRPAVTGLSYRQIQRTFLELANQGAGSLPADSLLRLQSHLHPLGERFVQTSDLESCLRLSGCADGHQVDPAEIHTPLALVGIGGDRICPPELIRELAASVAGNFCMTELHSRFGHDAYHLEYAAIRRLVNRFLQGLLV